MKIYRIRDIFEEKTKQDDPDKGRRRGDRRTRDRGSWSGDDRRSDDPPRRTSARRKMDRYDKWRDYHDLNPHLDEDVPKDPISTFVYYGSGRDKHPTQAEKDYRDQRSHSKIKDKGMERGGRRTGPEDRRRGPSVSQPRQPDRPGEKFKRGKKTVQGTRGKGYGRRGIERPVSYKTEDSITGGVADKDTITSLSKHHGVSVTSIIKELKRGLEVEMEHTDDPKKSIEIAMDHIKEDPKYYTKLEKIHTEEN